ncbi:uncharacterized protein DS421_15g503580 [Arachis hypogaea]|nr:uncharacterized protein DS421_15g503580 [Arachis hypogaea]
MGTTIVAGCGAKLEFSLAWSREKAFLDCGTKLEWRGSVRMCSLEAFELAPNLRKLKFGVKWSIRNGKKGYTIIYRWKTLEVSFSMLLESQELNLCISSYFSLSARRSELTASFAFFLFCYKTPSNPSECYLK